MMSHDARAALQSLVDMFYEDFRGPSPEELREAISTARWGLKGLDRRSDAWNPSPIKFTDVEVQHSLKTLCEIFSGPLMTGAPRRILDIVDAAWGHIEPDPAPDGDDAGLSPG